MPHSSTKFLLNGFLVAMLLADVDCQGSTSAGPICKDIDFIPDGDIIATTQPPFKVNSSLVFRCDGGYKAYGNPFITCMSNGRWSGPVPYCQTITCQRNTTKIKDGRKCRKSCTREADCKGQYKKCRCDDWCGMSCFNPDAICVALIGLENGYITGDERSYGRTVTYGCNEGFVLVGESTRRCQSDKNWSGSAPKCFAFSACGKVENRSPSLGNVVGGTDAKLGDWPWQALLFINSDHDVGQLYNIASGFGGGSIIDNKWILTAAHVIDEFPIAVKAKRGWKMEFLIALGITSYPKVGQDIPDHVHIYEPSDVHVYIHPKYDGSIYDYDVGLIRIGNRLKRVGDKFVIDSNAPEGLMTFTRYIRPVCLPCIKNYPTDVTTEWWNGFEKDKCAQESAKLIKEGENVWITGFGFTEYPKNAEEKKKFKPDTLKEGRLEIWSEAKCAKGLQEIRIHHEISRYTQRMFCTGSALQSKNVDSCQGDSGGAVVKQISEGEYWIELGIVSWGWECGTHLPGFNVRLPSVMTWVVKQVSGIFPDCTDSDVDWCATLVTLCYANIIKERCAKTCGQCDAQGGERWSPWGRWGDCDVTCGGGFRVRTRKCITNNCKGETTGEISCNDDPCPPKLDTFWTSWQDWGTCSDSCGGGFRIRLRECVHGEPGDVGCTGIQEDIQRCHQQQCPEWTSWTNSETSCSVTCGGGVIKRFRRCLYGQTEGACRNLGPSEDAVPCATNSCKVTRIMLFDEKSRHLQLFNPADNTLKQMQRYNKDMKRSSSGFTAVTLDDFIYVLMETKSVFRLKYFDERATWERMPDMIYDHGRHPPAAVMSGCIYVAGYGQWGTSKNAVEKFDPSSNKWSLLQKKKMDASWNALVVAQGFLYSIGGYLGNRGRLKEVERFDPASSNWTFVAPMKQVRHNAAAVEFNGKIFVLAGLVEGYLTRSAEIYDVYTNTWSALKSNMLKNRTTFGAFVVNGDIYAVGGYNEAGQTIEKYSMENAVWEEVQIQTKKEMKFFKSTKIEI